MPVDKKVRMANNHSSDLGQAARQATRRLFGQNDLTALTYEESPRFFRLGELTVGVVSLSMIPGRGERAVDVPNIDLRQKRCVFRISPPLIVNGITLRPANTPAKSNPPGFSLEAIREGRVLWRTHRANLVSMEPMRVGASHAAEYLFTLERHFSPLDGEEGLRPCVCEVRPEGLVPKWRGTALAWPLLDAALLPVDSGILCARHRGDSFIVPQRGSNEKRIAAYRWKGFGFSGIDDPESVGCSRDFFK